MSEFKSWEELSVLEQMASQYWDMYKDAYGIRPRGIDTSSWTEEDFLSEFKALSRIIDDNAAQKELYQAQAIARVEQHIADIIKLGAKTRETAINWLHDAEGSNGDCEYLSYLLGVPYRYFSKSA